MGKTALITGASAGIGAAFARRLAGDGYDLVLVARRQSRLAGLQGELERRHGITVSVMQADLAQSGEVARVAEAIERHPSLDMLINNAGFGTQGPFSEIELDQQLEMVAVHVVATMRLCRAALPGMIGRKRGTIVNVSSVAGFIPLAGRATYNSTKSFLTTFSQVLQAEVRDQGITVQALCPGFTSTEFHDTAAYGDFDRTSIPKWMWMPADKVVDISLAAIERNRVVVIPGLTNRLIVAAYRFRFTAAALRFLRRLVMGRWKN